jgi:hypothetical protein
MSKAILRIIAVLAVTIGSICYLLPWAWADQPASNVHAVTLHTSSGTLVGFVAVPAECDSGDQTLGKLKSKNYRVRFWSNLDRVKFPFDMLVSTGMVERDVKAAEINRIEWRSSSFDGAVLQGTGVPQVSSEQALLLKTKPVYSCAPTYTETGVYWLSYDPKVGKNELEQICTLPFTQAPTEEQRAPFAKNPKVIEFTFDQD